MTEPVTRKSWLTTLWTRKWLVIVPAVVSTVVTFFVTSVLPVRYKSETLIMVVPPKVSSDYVRATVLVGVEERLQSIREQILSRTRLERMIAEFNLYQAQRQRQTMEDAVQQLRKDIAVSIRGDGSSTFTVSFTGTEPRTVMKVTEKVAAMFIDESMHDREAASDNVSQFLAGQTEHAKRTLETYEATIASVRATGRQPSRVLEVEFEALQDVYKSLLLKQHEANLVQNLERRQIGEQFKLLDAARIPETPLGPNRRLVNAIGALSGLGLGLVLVATARRRYEGASDTAQPSTGGGVG